MNGTLENSTDVSVRFLTSGTAVNSVNLILGLPINGYVVWLILSGAGGTIASEFFYLNLTASVTIFSLASVFYLAWLFTHNYTFSMVFEVFNAISGYSGPSFQCYICVERYMAVVHPVLFLRYKALRYKVSCCCVVWLMVLAFSSFRFLSLTVLLYIYLGFDMVCISVLSFCCLSVLRALKQPGPGEGSRDGGEGNDMKRRAFKIILISLIVMLLNIISWIIGCLTYVHNNSMPAAVHITYAIAMMSAFAHPLLYIYKSGRLPCFKRF